MQTANNILLVRVPAQEAVDGRELRDYILESLAQGVLVLTEDASCEVMNLPPLGGVEIDVPALPPAVESAIESNPPGPEVDAGAAEKRDILQRLLDYRKANGLGCLNVVSAKTAYRKSDRISANTMRMIITGDAPKLDISEWRKIAIYTREGRLVRKVEDGGSQTLNGRLEHAITQQDKEDAGPEAQAWLTDHGLQQNLTVEVLDPPISLITGEAVILRDTGSGVSGLFWVDGDTHSWKNKIHTGKFKLNFRNMMNSSSAGQEL